ncbi:MAG: hypothetical protein H5U40_10440 [Polyangiaceae bacterium]|nr:hypothetical protein [Polyangiaceae bacterium]
MARAPLVIRTFESFLRAAIHRYWENPGRDRMTFLALLFATRESLPVALDRLTRPEAQKKALFTSAGAVAATVVLRTLLGGPVGLLLTAGSIAGLAQLYVQRAPEIKERSTGIRRVIGGYRAEVEAALDSGRAGALSEDQLDLVLEGLLGRFLLAIGEPVAPQPAAEPRKASEESFAAHVKKQRGVGSRD